MTNQQNKIRDFWNNSIPMTFVDKPKTYEEKKKFRYDLQDYMRDVFKFENFKGKRVLEIGVGGGLDTSEFLRNGAEVVSVDFSELSVKNASQLFKEAGLNGNVLLSDAKLLPFNDSEFDVVYSYGVIHHIPDVEKVLDEIRRVLRPGGIFMGMVYNKDSLLYAYSIIYLHGIKEGLLAQGMSEDELAAKFSERFTGNRYTKMYTVDDLKNTLGKFFQNTWIGTYYNVIDTPEKRKVKFETENKTNNLGWHLVFKATKEN